MEKTTELKTAREIALDDWKAEAIKLFGEDPKQWRFECSNCGHIQTPADFIELNDNGISTVGPETAWFSCIGRFDTRIPDDQIGEIGDSKQPCNYTLGGLFVLAKTLVIRDGAKPKPVFEFAS